MKPINLIICGVGGQGVNFLSECLQKTILQEGYNCAGSIFKGGAQRMGSVYSMIRIHQEEELSPTFGKGEADMVIALEAWEAVRFHAFYHPETHFFINQYKQIFYSERFENQKDYSSTWSNFINHFKRIELIDFDQQAKEICGSEQMMNMIMGAHAIASGLLPITLNSFLYQYEQKTKNSTLIDQISRYYETFERK